MKRWLAVLACAAVLVTAGCAQVPGEGSESGAAQEEGSSGSEAQEESSSGSEGQEEGSNGSEAQGESSETDGIEGAAGDGAVEGTAAVRVGSLKGPTSIGLVSLMEADSQGTAGQDYTFEMEAGADALLAAMVNEELDIALIPANAAAIWYQRLEQQVRVIDINTLGVLYMVSSDGQVDDVEDLRGRTIALTGMGTSPDYVLQYVLAGNGIALDEVTLEYKAEAAEVVTALAEGTADIGLLPQPYVTAACAKDSSLQVVLDMTEQWDALQEAGGSRLVTGVTVVRQGFLEEHPQAVELFLEEHAASVEAVNSDVETAAALVAGLGIIENETLAAKAIPQCNIACITGQEMKDALEGYLAVLFDYDPATVGGAMPDEAFYYMAE